VGARDHANPAHGCLGITATEKESTMTNNEALKELVKMRDEDQSEYKLASNPNRPMRKSERAMTLMKYSMRISALQVAITVLENSVALTWPRQKRS